MQTSLLGHRAALFAALGLWPLVACGGSTSEPGSEAGGSGGASTGGAEAMGGVSTGGANATGGASTGGANATGGASTGGANATGGSGGATTGGTGGKMASSFPSCPPPPPGREAAHPGYVSCGSGLHRASRESCTAPPRETGYACVAPAGISPAGCKVDADCTERPNGSCDLVQDQGTGCFCLYGCVQDSDCGSGQICVCGPRYGSCRSATCTVDADCDDGALCLSHDPMPGCNGQAFACQSPGDQCTNDEDCTIGSYCSAVNGARKCAPASCAAGRPFLVGGAARVAPLVGRSDWCSALSPCIEGLPAESRRVLAETWAHVALMEHASVAAFARFALELLSLGAPASLVEAAHAAMGDETAHARDAFALASAYGGAPLGPGEFEGVTEALAGRSGEDIVLTAILEGCIGETVAAAEAAEALARATDGAVREALTKVAADEARHSTLAWQFVRWVLAKDPAGLRVTALAGLRAAVDAELAAAEPQGPSRDVAPALAAHGYVDDALRREIRQRVMMDVVAPCARALAGAARARTQEEAPS